MSDYIYSNNFSSEPDKNSSEPINLYFEAERNRPKPIKKGTIALICSLCILFSGVAGGVGAAIVNSATSGGGQSSPIVANVVYKSPTGIYAENDLALPNGMDDLKDAIEKNAVELTLPQVINLVDNSVVEIRTQYVTSSYYQYVTSGAGSGVIIGSFQREGTKNEHDGYYIITNAHVITNDKGKTATSITVALRDGTEYEATVKGYDTDGDIAVLMIEESEKDLVCASFVNDSDDLMVGESVIAIGNPLGELGGSVTTGIISALDREISVDGTKMNLLQIDAAINPGNSGGGLFNMKGELIGIVNAKSTGSDIEGIGFAIPANDAFRLSSDIINYGYVVKSYIGVGYNIGKDGNIYVVSLDPGYNDGEGGFQVGDIILSINGKELTSSSDIKYYVSKSKIGDKIEFLVRRDGTEITVTATVKAYSPQ
ncbi:MAG: S1C family serine protease [Eubacteriales bacterium]